MKYTIFKLDCINIKGTNHTTLVEPDFGPKTNEFDSIEDATKFLETHKEEYNFGCYVALPYIRISAFNL